MKSFSIKEGLTFGWNVTKNNFLFFAGVLLVLFVVQMLVQGISTREEFALIAGIIALAVSVVFKMGMIAISLKFADGGKAVLSDLYSNIKPFWRFLGASVVFGLGTTIGLILFIVPGIIFALACQYFGYLIVDRGLGIIESLKRSAEITKGVRWQLLGFAIILWLLNLAGMMLLFVGLFVTVPITMVTAAYVFRKLEAATPTAGTKKRA